MIAYFDTSALVPLFTSEPTSAQCHEVWAAADQVLTTRLSYVETSAALARAERLGRITAHEHDIASAEFNDYWLHINVIDVNQELARSAAALTRSHALRGYDAVHCAAAVKSASSESLAISGDRKMLEAWAQLGLAFVDVSRNAKS